MCSDESLFPLGDGDSGDEPPFDVTARPSYYAALGRFLVAFNDVEGRVAGIIRTALTKLDSSELCDRATGGDLRRKLQDLELILLAFPGVPPAPDKRILALNDKRNDLAHGHFDQCPVTGGYQIRTRRAQVKDYPVATIDDLTDEAHAIYSDLGLILAHFWFDSYPGLGPDLPPRPGDVSER